jgi:hypothetical protein
MIDETCVPAPRGPELPCGEHDSARCCRFRDACDCIDCCVFDCPRTRRESFAVVPPAQRASGSARLCDGTRVKL